MFRVEVACQQLGPDGEGHRMPTMSEALPWSSRASTLNYPQPSTLRVPSCLVKSIKWRTGPTQLIDSCRIEPSASGWGGHLLDQATNVSSISTNLALCGPGWP